MIQNNIVDIVHVRLIHIFLPWFLMDDVIDLLLFDLGHLYISLDILNTRV